MRSLHFVFLAESYTLRPGCCSLSIYFVPVMRVRKVESSGFAFSFLLWVNILLHKAFHLPGAVFSSQALQIRLAVCVWCPEAYASSKESYSFPLFHLHLSPRVPLGIHLYAPVRIGKDNASCVF